MRLRSALLRKFVLVLGVVLAFCACAEHAFAADPTEQAKIIYLINAVGNSKATFIRNGKEYTGQEAKKHMEEKATYFREKIHTADDFIRLAGTKSLLTGKPYIVRLEDGTIVTSEKWLHEQLSKFH